MIVRKRWPHFRMMDQLRIVDHGILDKCIVGKKFGYCCGGEIVFPSFRIRQWST